MYAIEHDNPKLRGKLPRDYARRGIAPQRQGGRNDLIGSMTIGSDEARAKDVLGRVYEYFLSKFAAGLGGQDVGVLSEELLGQLAGMRQKNLALETLRKLLNDQIRSRERVNIVQSRGFRESLEATLTR